MTTVARASSSTPASYKRQIATRAWRKSCGAMLISMATIPPCARAANHRPPRSWSIEGAAWCIQVPTFSFPRRGDMGTNVGRLHALATSVAAFLSAVVLLGGPSITAAYADQPLVPVNKLHLPPGPYPYAN